MSHGKRGEERRGEVLLFLRSTISTMEQSSERVAGKAELIKKASGMIEFLTRYKTPEHTMGLFEKEIREAADRINSIINERNKAKEANEQKERDRKKHV